MTESARVWTLGDNVDTDLIIPAAYLSLPTVSEMARHTFESLRPELAHEFEVGDVLVTGSDFGCGSSREHAVLVLKELGVSCIVAKSFARVFFRNGINNGLLLLQTPSICIPDGDHISIDQDNGKVRHEESGQDFEATPLPAIVQDIIRAGGLIPYVNSRSAASLHGRHEAKGGGAR